MGLLQKTAVGIEATSAGVRVVEVVLSRAPEVRSLSEVLIAPEDQRHGVGLDVITMGTKLEEALTTAKPRKMVGREAYLTVPEDKVFRKILEIPASVRDDELLNVVRTEVASYLPSELATMELDFQLLPRRNNQVPVPVKEVKEKGREEKDDKRDAEEKKSEESKKAEPAQPPLYVSVVAVEKQVIQEIIALCAHSKLLPTSIDTRPAAIARAVVPPKELEVTIVVEWHGGEAMVAVVENGVVWATGMTKAGEDTSVAAAAIADELEHAVKFFMNRTGSAGEIAHAYIVSAHAEAGALRKALEKLLDSDTKVLEGIPVVPLPEGGDTRFAAALGAALYPLYASLV